MLNLSGADLSAYKRAREVLDPFKIAIEIAAVEFAHAKSKLGDTTLSEAIGIFIKLIQEN